MHTLKKFFLSKGGIALICAVLLLLFFFLSLSIGATQVSLGKVFEALAGKNTQSPETRIVLYVRMPRTLAALSAGAGLAVAGAILQTVMQNPLASTGIMGINAGSGVMVLISAVFLPIAYYVRPLFAFAGALISALAVYFIAAKTGAGKTTIILSGVAVSSLLTAIIDVIITLYPSAATDRIAFTIGGFAGVNMTTVIAASVCIAIGIVGGILLSFDMNLLSLGDEMASSLGMRTRLTKFFCIMIAALLSGAAISMAGLIGFIGLIVPHFVRMVSGGDCRSLIPFSAVVGGAFTMACDLAARTVFSPYELPVGIILSVLGAPFFLFLLMKHRKGGKRVKA